MAAAATATSDDAQGFQISPQPENKLRSGALQEVLKSTLASELAGFRYSYDACNERVNAIAESVRNRLHELGLPRYKYVVHVVLGEERGGGVKVGARCYWDADTDLCTAHTFMGENFFCSASVFGVFYY